MVCLTGVRSGAVLRSKPFGLNALLIEKEAGHGRSFGGISLDDFVEDCCWP